QLWKIRLPFSPFLYYQKQLVDFGIKRWVNRTTCEERGAVGRKGRSLSSMQQERGTKGNHKALVAAIKRFLSDVKQRP
ncbi:MAG TPA: hypothetical protein PL057_03505, partial [Bacillota bacterium]|nr:hypothetical protein [Bacillota bacterium]